MDKYLKYAKLFYEDARRFALCGDNIRFSSIREEDSQYLFAPLIFIERHTTELLLKSLILYSLSSYRYFKQEDISKIDILNLNGNSTGRTLFNAHSLLDLLNFYKYIESQKLCPNYTEDEIKMVENTIMNVEKFDRASTFFRYPCNKNRGIVVTNERKYVQKIDTVHPISTLKDGFFVLKNNNEIQYSIKNIKIVKMEYDLTKTIIILLKLNPFHNTETN